MKSTHAQNHLVSVPTRVSTGIILSDENNDNKKVLLRERKRHTARRVVSTPSVVLTGYPPHLTGYPPGGGYPDLDLTGYPPGGGTQSGTPPGGYPDPPGGYPVRYPRGGTRTPRGGTRSGTPPGGYPDLDLTGYPPRGVPGPGPDWVPPPRGGVPGPPHCLMAFWEMLQSIMGYGYPPVWTDKQSETITFPSYYVRGR